MKLTSFALVEKNDKYLLVCETSIRWKGHWFFPGGQVKKDESPEMAAVRETKEETGNDIKLDGMFYSKYNPGILIAELCFYYHAELDPLQVTIIDGSELLKYEWFTYDEILNLPLRENALDIINTYRNLKKHRPQQIKEYA
ncbi:MAG TPA: NUDIX hydrolase [Bacteroidia bacterium]|jgi:8-oxo-dGTP pyrophosphatase MutT (NUDIX family)|nr:NUDIX hydrolase [Bacteroidia bacterium]